MNVEVLDFKLSQNNSNGGFIRHNDYEGLCVRFIGTPEKVFRYYFDPQPEKLDLDKEKWNLNETEEAQTRGIPPRINRKEVIGDRPWFFYKVDNFEEEKDYGCQPRQACFVIDQNDNNKLKVYASPISLIRQMEKVCGKNPVEEHIFEIFKRGSGINTRYEINLLRRSALSLDEERMINGTCPLCVPSDILVHKKEIEIVYEEYEMIEDRCDILDI